MDANLTPEQNIKDSGFWHCFFTRVYKLILDLVHIRSVLFIVGSVFTHDFMDAYLRLGDKAPSPYLAMMVAGLWFMLALGVGWNRTWEQVWASFGEALKNYKKS